MQDLGSIEGILAGSVASKYRSLELQLYLSLESHSDAPI